MQLAEQILIADDHPLFRQALKQTLMDSLPEVDWLEAETVEQLDARLAEDAEGLDLLLLDLQLPGAHGFSTLIHVRNHYPDLPVVIISAHEEVENIRTAMQCGASGFIPKSQSADRLQEAVSQVLNGNTWVPDPSVLESATEASDMAERLASLTPQQYKILMMFAEGLLNKQIAYDLAVSEATVKAHATAIFRKLNVRNRTQAVIALGEVEVEHRPLA